MDIYTLTNGNGLTARITDIGARIVSLLVPDRNGNLCDIVLGFDNLDDYLPQNHLSDFGALIGRYANRIGNGRFILDGQTYQLPQNNGPHCLHGGPTGWQYARFQLVECSPRSLTLQLLSPDGDNGFPGDVRVQVVYTLGDENSLDISYRAVSDAPTVINITNHSYFNLSGDPNRDILDHILAINADRYTPIDNTSIPLGPLECVEGTPLDFRSPKPIGRDIEVPHPQLVNGSGFDHNYVLNACGDISIPAARLESPTSGIVMDLFTTEPGVQLYTGNFLDGTVVGKRGIVYGRRSAVCLETQKFPDSPNHQWPNSDATLLPGQEFRSRTRFCFSVR